MSFQIAGPALRHVSFIRDPQHPEDSEVLDVCVARNIPVVTLRYVNDVSDDEIVDFLFSDNNARTAKQLVIRWVNVGGVLRNDCVEVCSEYAI